ncbi:hypothetical protein R3I93_019847 [Phoxinus phoxinus]|uniref:Uncharacterized protein n=1 Tax=Phoxinus phoxinus TaxID=58324 RepID=A0AAN9CBY2_9TELE
MSHKMSTMEKSTWEETIHTLKSSGGICLPHPRDVSEWGDDMKQWPHITKLTKCCTSLKLLANNKAFQPQE